MTNKQELELFEKIDRINIYVNTTDTKIQALIDRIKHTPIFSFKYK